MSALNWSRRAVLLVVCALLCVSARIQGQSPENSSKAPKPDLLVSLSQSSIRENDEVSAVIWISNGSDISLSSLRLQITSPETLKWCEDSCNSGATSGDIALGLLAAHSAISKKLCLKSGSTVLPGNVNLLFTVVFDWKGKDNSGESFVSVEKPLTVALLGTDTLAGVPLGIAGLVAPGLLFWLIVNAIGASWGPGIALGDKMIYSVLTSAVIMVLLSPFRYFNMRTGLSIPKLACLAIIGAGLGAFVGGIDWIVRYVKRQNLDAQTVNTGDNQSAALGKLLRAYEDKSIAKTVVRLTNGEQYVGSLGQKNSNVVTLAGWFRLHMQDIPDERVGKLRRQLQEKKYLQLFTAAQRNGWKMEASNYILKREADGREVPTADATRSWKPDEVQELASILGEPKWPPLGLPS
jgi:hypothetical protein